MYFTLSYKVTYRSHRPQLLFFGWHFGEKLPISQLCFHSFPLMNINNCVKQTLKAAEHPQSVLILLGKVGANQVLMSSEKHPEKERKYNLSSTGDKKGTKKSDQPKMTAGAFPTQAVFNPVCTKTCEIISTDPHTQRHSKSSHAHQYTIMLEESQKWCLKSLKLNLAQKMQMFEAKTNGSWGEDAGGGAFLGGRGQGWGW